MHNELFTIGPFTVYGYGLMIAIGILSAYFLAEYRAKKLPGLDEERIFGMTCWAVICGLIGGKLLFYITILSDIFADPTLLYRDMTSGFVIYGALIGGFLGIYFYCKHWKMNMLAYMDLTMPSVALGQGFGRIGCLLAGCCYGEETTSAFGIVFENSAYAPNGIALIPTQVISSVLDFAHFAFLLLFAKKYKKAEGQITGLYFMCYSVGRFILEFFRGDVARGMVGVLSTSQFIAIFTFLFGAWLYKRSTKRPTLLGTSGDTDVCITMDGEDGPTAVFLAGKVKGSEAEHKQKLEAFAEQIKTQETHTLEEVESWIQEKYGARLISSDTEKKRAYQIFPGAVEEGEGNVLEVSFGPGEDLLQIACEFTDPKSCEQLEAIRREIYIFYGATEEDAKQKNVRFMTLAAVMGVL